MFKKTFGCGSLILVFIITVSVIMVGGYLTFNKYISPYLNNAEIQEVYNIYMELSEPVNEGELITNAPQETDYDNAKTKLVAGGIHIFNEYGDIDPSLIEQSNFFPTGAIALTDKELAILINKFIENPLNLEQIGITSEQIGGLYTEVLEVNIEETGIDTVNLRFVVKLDMTTIKSQLGFFGLFLPDELYITNENTLELVNGEYVLINGSIHVNNLEEETNTRMLEILVEALNNIDENLTVESLHQGVGELILSGIEEASNTFNTDILFTNGFITFTPQI